MVEKANANVKPRRKTASRATGAPSEHDIQVECVSWFHDNFSLYSGYFWAVPNGGYRSKRTAAIMKQEGQQAGVLDLQLAFPSKGYHGLFIEMKKSRVGKRGKVVGKTHTSELQDAMIERLRKVGYMVAVCYSFEDFKKTIREYLL